MRIENQIGERTKCELWWVMGRNSTTLENPPFSRKESLLQLFLAKSIDAIDWELVPTTPGSSAESGFEGAFPVVLVRVG